MKKWIEGTNSSDFFDAGAALLIPAAAAAAAAAVGVVSTIAPAPSHLPDNSAESTGSCTGSTYHTVLQYTF